MRLKLKEVRQRKFMTQAQLAEKIGTSKANISKLETEQREPRASTVLKLAEALGVAPEELVDWGAGDEGAGQEKAAA